MSPDEVCEIVADEVHRISPRFMLTCIPMSDGGEGMAESYLGRLGGERCRCICNCKATMRVV